MGSGINSSAQGKYTGNGGSAPIEIKPGFEPKSVKIFSANGAAQAGGVQGGKVFKQDVAGAMTVLTAGLAIGEFGFTVSGSDAVLNANGVEYYYECY